MPISNVGNHKIRIKIRFGNKEKCLKNEKWDRKMTLSSLPYSHNRYAKRGMLITGRTSHDCLN